MANVVQFRGPAGTITERGEDPDPGARARVAGHVSVWNVDANADTAVLIAQSTDQIRALVREWSSVKFGPENVMLARADVTSVPGGEQLLADIDAALDGLNELPSRRLNA